MAAGRASPLLGVHVMARRNKMNMIKKLALAASFVLVVMAFVPAANADDWNEETLLTFSAPVEVPGMALPAGTYQFQMLNGPASDIVLIFSANGRHFYTSVMGIADYRQETPDKTIVTFEERAKGVPEAIHSWFYPGNNYGVEFVYPPVKANQMAKGTAGAVPCGRPAAN